MEYGVAMDRYFIFLILLAGYISLLVITGIYFNRRQTSLREFLLAGKRSGALSLGFSAAASWLTAGALLAVTGFFMLLGMGSIWGFVAPNILALIGIAFLVKKIRSIPAMTQPEILEIRYGSFVRLPVALIIIVVMILFAVADIKGFAMVLEVFYNIDRVHAALIVAGSVAVYVSLGGLSAVIATDVIQFVCLALFIGVMAILVPESASGVRGENFLKLAGGVDGSWWNPLSIGLPMVLIFCLAILPGWITEQDPWQKVWAAKSTNSARLGLIIGSLLVALVFAGCAIIAIGLKFIYPEISAMGFPMGMAKAEPALLTFIMDNHFSDFSIALCAVALATAAMSCTDTFAASGASCIARDIYQRLINPGASMKEMMSVNRASVLFIIGAATLGSFFIDSIIDAIHIATFIASASYFFVLMGGLYWRRGTAAGAGASMATGFLIQCILVIIDLGNTKPEGAPFLESIHPALMGHGVIVAMAASGIAYFGVSLITAPSKQFRLAPFFREDAEALVRENGVSDEVEPVFAEGHFIEKNDNESLYISMKLEVPAGISWRGLIRLVESGYPHWISFSGHDSIRRCTRVEMESCVSLIRGESSDSASLEIEGMAGDSLEELKEELTVACSEIKKVLSGVGSTFTSQAV